MRQRLTFYVSREQLEYLRREAARRRRSLSSYVADCVLQCHQQPRRPDADITTMPPFDSLLRESERRLREFIDRNHATTIAPVTKQLGLLAAMLDRFVMSFLLHAPEIPTDRHSAALASAERRHGNWRQAVIEMLEETGTSEEPERALEDRT